MPDINKYFLNSYNPPDLIKIKQDILEYGDVHKYLRSLQIINLSKNEIDELAKDEDSWFYKSDLEIYDKLSTMNKMFEESKFDNIKDGYGISEYIGVYEKYIPSLDYLQYILMNDKDMVINVYDAYNLYNISKRNQILRDKIVGQLLIRNNDDYDQTIPDYNFNIYNKIKYTKFVDRKYDPDVLISCFQDPVHILSVNLPYNFYMYQPIPHNIYTWNIETKQHKFGSLNEMEFNILFNDICTNGITKPLFMRMNGEVLSSTDEETNLILLIAKILKLPSIPVNIYLSNEDIGKNHLIDVIFNNSNKNIYSNIGFMKGIFEPYLIVHKPNDEVDIENVEKYSVFSENNNLTIRYLTDTEYKSDSSDDIINIHSEMRNKENDLINNEIDKIINKLMNGQE